MIWQDRCSRRHAKTMRCIVAAAALTCFTPSPQAGASPSTPAGAHLVSRVSADTTVPLALTLPLRNQSRLTDLLTRLYDPKDALYHHYLTPAQFTAQFGPTQSDYDQVIAFAQQNGLKVTSTSSNRTVLNVSGTSAQIEAAFGVQLSNYVGADGRVFHASSASARIPVALKNKIAGVIGLDESTQLHTHAKRLESNAIRARNPHFTGSGPGNALAPADIKKAYNVTGMSQTGTGQTIALFELAGYTTSDITAYKTYYGLPNTTVTNVLVNGYSGTPGSGADEVTLDIELQIALAPNSTILVYEASNTWANVVNVYNQIATDNAAQQVSTSWGLYETGSPAYVRAAENTAFQQMAAQGQSIYAASGDAGAYDNGSSLTVDDPASQPYMTGVGGTNIELNNDGTYKRENAWSDGVSNGGGGGVSSLWSKPVWQTGFGTSSTMRNVPDVCLESDPNTGYSIYYNGGWWIYGGTSCAAPLWAAYTALVNQQRAASGLGTLGYMNPTLYQIAAGANYSSDFLDPNLNGSGMPTDNLYYATGAGYDNATGLGSFNGLNLINDLQMLSAPANVTATGVSSTQINLSWSAVASAASYNIYRSTTPDGYHSFVSSTTSTSYSNVGLDPSTTYYYIVTGATGTGQQGQKSFETPGTTLAGAPNAPINVVATGVSPTQINLTWNTAVTATSYNIYRGTTAGGSHIWIASSTTGSYSNLGLTSGTTYYYIIRAVNALGEGTRSAETAGSTLVAIPGTPTNVTATGINGSQINVSWDAVSGATTYNVYRSTTAGGAHNWVGSTSSTSFTNSGLTGSTTYYYIVRASNSTGEGPRSTETPGTTLVGLPGTPVNIVATGFSTTQVNLTWDAVAGATSYNVYRSTTAGGVHNWVGSTATASFSNTGLTTGTTYYYIIRAINSAGEGAKSTETPGTTL